MWRRSQNRHNANEPASHVFTNVSSDCFICINFLLTEKLWGFARASYSFTGTAANDLGSDVEIPEYEIVNIRAGVERENWQVAVFVNNVFDEQISLGNVEGTQDLYSLDPVNVYGRPRTIGVNLKFNF